MCSDPQNNQSVLGEEPCHAQTGRSVSLRASASCTVHIAAAQGLTGALIGTVKDAQGGVLPGAIVRVSSPALIGGPMTLTTNEKGQLRFPALPPGLYALDIEARRDSAPYHEEDIRIGAGATIERTAVLDAGGHRGIAGRRGSRLAHRSARQRIRDPLRSRRPQADPGAAIQHVRLHQGRPWRVAHLAGKRLHQQRVGVRLGHERERVPHRRHELHLPVQRRVARSEPGVDFIQEVQVQSVGASAEFGNMQGAVINVVTRQGGDRFLYDASYYGQAAGLTSQPVHAARIPAPASRPAGTSATGTATSRRTSAARSCAIGCGSLRDTSTCATTTVSRAPTRHFPRTYEQDKIFAKLTWRLTPGLQLMQSFHDEFWVNPELADARRRRSRRPSAGTRRCRP